MKTLAYLDSVLAMAEARAKGADDALMFATDGLIASTSMANVFVVSGSTLSTPRRADAILPGVMRETLLDLAPTLGLEPVERALHRDDLYRADLVFVTNSLRLMTRVAAVDGVILSHQKREIWNSLQSMVENDISQLCNGFFIRQKTG